MTDDVGRKPIAITWIRVSLTKKKVQHAEEYEKNILFKKRKHIGNILVKQG